ICQLIPRSNIGNAALVTGDDHFGSLGDLAPVVAACGRGATSASLREYHLARAGRTNVAADGAEHSDHIVVRRVQFLVVADQNLGEEKEHDRGSDEPARAGDGEPEQKPEG